MNSGYKVLDNEFSKLLNMNFLLLGFGKVGFCEMFVKRGTLQKSGREVLRGAYLAPDSTPFVLRQL